MLKRKSTIFGFYNHYKHTLYMIFLFLLILLFIPVQITCETINFDDLIVEECIVIAPPTTQRIEGRTPRVVPYEDPPVLLAGQQPAYPEKLLKVKISGTVILDIEVYEDGSIGAIEVFKSLMAGPGGFDDVTINTVRQTWKFAPAKSGSNSVSCWVKKVFKFDPPPIDSPESMQRDYRPPAPTGNMIDLKQSITGDEPPVILSGEHPSYPVHLLNTNKSGQVVLDIEVKHDGTIGTIEVLKSLMKGPLGFDGAAINTVRQWKIKPAMVGGNPIACHIRQTFNFTPPIKGLEE